MKAIDRKTIDRIGGWLLTGSFFTIGIMAVVTHRLPQGKGVYRMAMIEGRLAVVFGCGMIIIATYFTFLLLRKKA